VISASPADLQPVVQALAEHASRLLRADAWRILLGDTEAALGYLYDPISARAVPFRPDHLRVIGRDTPTGRAILDRRTIHIADPELERDEDWGRFKAGSRRQQLRTALAVPLLRDGVALGSITVRRREARPFTPREIALLELFADQAVIAIENA